MELAAIPFALDGYLTDDTRPGARPGTASFRLACSTGTDYLVDEAVIPCTTVQPEIADALLTERQPGDLLRMTGYLTLPATAGSVMRFDTDTLEVLWETPLLSNPEDEDSDTASTPDGGADRAVTVLTEALTGLARTEPATQDGVRIDLDPAGSGPEHTVILPPGLAHRLADYVTTMACHLDSERPDELDLDADTLADLTDLFDAIDPMDVSSAVLRRTPPERRAAVTRALDDVFPDDRDPEDLEP